MITFSDSYRWRLLSISLLTGGLSLVVFGGFSWKQIYSSKESTLDLQLQNFATRYGGKLFALTTPEHAFQAESNASQLNEVLDLSGYECSIVDFRKKYVWSSEQWPEALEVAHYASLASDQDPISPPRTGTPPPGAPARGLRPPNSHPTFPPPPTNLSARGIQKPILETVLKLEEAMYEDFSKDNLDYRLYILPVHRAVIIVAASKQQLHAEMREVLLSYLLALPISAFFIIVGAVFLGNQAIRPIKKLTASAESIDGNQLKDRIAPQGSSREFAQLIEVYNRMLDRLETSFLQAKRFSADAAHELNTPLTILQGNLENALQEAEVGSDTQQQYSSLLDEVNLLISIVNKLLMLSRVDSGNMKPEFRTTSISGLIEHLLEDADILFEGLNFQQSIQPNLFVSTDLDWLRQILNNLFSNARKYNIPGGWVDVSLTQQKDWIAVQVSNSGNPIPASAEKHIFDRFYRVDGARTHTRKSLGLGLSLSREFAQMLGGRLELSRNDSDAIAFTLLLPTTHKTA